MLGVFAQAGGSDGGVSATTVAALSLAVSVTSLLWNLSLYRLSGARLEVRLIPAAFGVGGALFRGPDAGWRAGPPAEFADRMTDYVDLAILKVTNVGRSPVSVTDLALDFGRTSWRPAWRHTMAGTPVVVADCKDYDGEVRLEAGQSFSVAYDHEPMVEYMTAPERSGRPRRSVRATGRAAGRRPTRSSWRKRWRIGRGQSIYLPGDRPADHDAFVEVFRVAYRHGIDKVYGAWVAVGSLWLHSRTFDVSDIARELREAIGLEAGDLSVYSGAMTVARVMPEERLIGQTVMRRGQYAEDFERLRREVAELEAAAGEDEDGEAEANRP